MFYNIPNANGFPVATQLSDEILETYKNQSVFEFFKKYIKLIQ